MFLSKRSTLNEKKWLTYCLDPEDSTTDLMYQAVNELLKTTKALDILVAKAALIWHFSFRKLHSEISEFINWHAYSLPIRYMLGTQKQGKSMQNEQMNIGKWNWGGENTPQKWIRCRNPPPVNEDLVENGNRIWVIGLTDVEAVEPHYNCRHINTHVCKCIHFELELDKSRFYS